MRALERANSAEGQEPRLARSKVVTPVPEPMSRLVALNGNHGLGAEKFRVLATRLKALQSLGELRRVLLTSSVPNEGKSLVAANLALTLAKGGQTVLLLGGDLRRSKVSRLFGLGDLKGLTDYLQGSGPVGDYIYQVDTSSLWILPGGGNVEYPLEVLQSVRLTQLLQEISQFFDWMIIDCPPLLPLADASLWLVTVDAVLMVVRQNHTPKKLLQKALEGLDKSKLLGFVLNECNEIDNCYYKNYLPAGSATASKL
jgi:capsular exopolysaccharide synthesis family protein